MTAAAEKFISRWSNASGSELANAQLFITELCGLLELEVPHPASVELRDNRYVFERRVIFQHGDGTSSEGRIDCYRRGAFVLESKKIKDAPIGKGFDLRMQRARGQAEAYARALPASEGRPPFVIVVDVGHVIELYAEFSRTGATYTPFPDSRSHRIKLADLRQQAIRERLQALWNDPASLDPARKTAEVTREVAERLALVAKALEGANHHPEEVAGFLTRCLFSMFAEDVGLLPKRSFADLLAYLSDHPEQFVPMLTDVWQAMDKGEFSTALRGNVLRFNGKLFKAPNVLPLNREHIDLLRQAAGRNWKLVEPAIFGTLLERALNPLERHALGAHYTPRAYVERLVLPTIVEPLRGDWEAAKGAALVLARDGKMREAQALVRSFHRELCEIRVLDPACGSGNFLYVALEHMKRLEGEVLNQLEAFGDTQALIEGEGLTVDPHQFLGIEINTRAAAIAELVLWIGYLQWHFRTRGEVLPPQPVLRDFANIENRDALLAYDEVQYVMDTDGKAVSRWDGRTFKPHPVTGEAVPDTRATVALERYVKPRAAVWPRANFIIGNPPFIGAASMRQTLGDGYTEALRATWKAVPESADFVMYWWHHAAGEVSAGRTRRFGLITTNSLRQTFNRRVIEAHLSSASASASAPSPSTGEGWQVSQKRGAGTGSGTAKITYPLAIKFAIPDHPWVDSAQGAAVRIAMTVGVARTADTTASELLLLASESEGDVDAREVTFNITRGTIHADLTVGANVSGAVALRSNDNISTPGVKLHGAGFIVTKSQAKKLGLGTVKGTEKHIREYRNGRDFASTPRQVMVIDLLGLTESDVRKQFPLLFQRVVGFVKPERDQNNRESYRKYWWIFGEPRKEMRPALAKLSRYITTIETAKHRTFQFFDTAILPDNMLIAIAVDDAFYLGVLSSCVHVIWTLAQGGTLEDRPRYNKTRCFETFPFPDASPKQRKRIRDLAEELDQHRKRQQALHPMLTLTGIYNVLEKLKTGAVLTAKEKTIHEDGLVAVLKSLHDQLDREVLGAYGWVDLVPLMDVANGSVLKMGIAPNPSTGAAFEGNALKVPVDIGSPSNATAQSSAQSTAKQQLTATLLERLVALNTTRAMEEKTGTVRWLRPDYQAPHALDAAHAPTHTQGTLDVDRDESIDARSDKSPWPSALAAQIRALADLLNASGSPVALEDIARTFGKRGTWQASLIPLLESLEAMGRARRTDDDKWMSI